MKWRRKRGRVDGSLEILLKIKNTKEYMIRPEGYIEEREADIGLLREEMDSYIELQDSHQGMKTLLEDALSDNIKADSAFR